MSDLSVLTLEKQTQTFECDPLVYQFDRATLFVNQFGEATRGDDTGGLADLFAEPIDHRIGLTGKVEDQSALYGVAGRGADRLRQRRIRGSRRYVRLLSWWISTSTKLAAGGP